MTELHCKCGHSWDGRSGDSCLYCNRIVLSEAESEISDGVWLWASDWGGYDERIYAICRTAQEAEQVKNSDSFTHGDVFFVPFGEIE